MAIGLLPLIPASVGKTGVVLRPGRQSMRVSSGSNDPDTLYLFNVTCVLKAVDNFRKLVLNALLWTAKARIPKRG